MKEVKSEKSKMPEGSSSKKYIIEEEPFKMFISKPSHNIGK